MELRDVEQVSRLVVKNFLKESEEDLEELFGIYLSQVPELSIELTKIRVAVFNNVLAISKNNVEPIDKDYFVAAYDISPHTPGEEG